jgi:transcription initiation factor TFIIIB Brf1 subunit/transcription initiation factor TFIIB
MVSCHLAQRSDFFLSIVISCILIFCRGSACMWMASKMEEITSPSVDDFVYISADSYTRLDITEMEMAVCDALQFRLYQVTPHDFVEQYLLASMANRRFISCPVLENHVERSMVEYLLELSFLPYELVTISPSKIAAAAMYLSRVVLGLPGWNPTLEYASGLCQWDLEDTVRIIHKYHAAAEESKLANAFNKYSKKKHHSVALKTVPLEQHLGF